MSNPRKRKVTSTDGVQFLTEAQKPLKKCDRRGCSVFSGYPFCFLQASGRCARNGHTSRWYHLSAGQHFCNECFEHFYRSNKPGNALYKDWYEVWEREAGGRVPAGPKMFLVDQFLPIWVKCTLPDCQKWRKLPHSIELHHVKQEIVRCSNCQMPEDTVVSLVSNPEWINSMSYPPLLRYSILAPLLGEYVPDGVGISPATIQNSPKTSEGEDKISPSNVLLLDPLHPFNHPQEGPRARAFTPDNMEPEEIVAFQEYYKVHETAAKWHSPKMELYCIMRNIILALWFMNYKEYLSEKMCVQALSLRGLVRIWCANEMGRILHFLTQLGYVNCGIISSIPRPFPFVSGSSKRSSVLVVGAGAAGITVAFHLRNFGHKVAILEASSRIGGRVHDDFSLGPCVGLGAMFITGISNNPFTLLARQLDMELRLTNDDHCELISESGHRPDQLLDKAVEKHFNSTLDLLAEWRNKTQSDASLGEKLEELHKMERGDAPCSEEETQLLDFHYSNLEFACGATLDKISALHWDHNDEFDQFSGCHALLPSGYHFILSQLALGTEIHLNTAVKDVRLTEEGSKKVVVVDWQGKEWPADKVVITVPLAVLKTGTITFTPPLSKRKEDAIQRLGAGLVEKVALKFSTPFWKPVVGNADFFGHVSRSRAHRGMFGIFYDMSPPEEETITEESGKSYILLTTVCGEALKDFEKMTDQEIVSLCVKTLQLMFPGEQVAPPIGYVVTHWGSNPLAGMSYSFVAVGASGEEYDAMAEEEWEGRLLFAGEATNRQYPQTVTGAYLSGIREACKIIEEDKPQQKRK